MAIDTTAPIPPAAANHAARNRALRVGYLFAALSAVLFATKGVVIKLAYAEGLDAETLLALRMGFALPVYLMVGAVALRSPAGFGRSLPSFRLALASAGIGALGYYVSSYLDFLGLEHISAQFERVILFTYPAFVVLFGSWFFGLKASRRTLVAIAVAYCGLALMFGVKVGELGASAYLGVGFVLAAAVSFAFYQLLAKPVISRVGPSLFTCIAMSAAAILALAQFFATRSLSDITVTHAAFWYAVLLAVGATILPSFLLAAALHRISAQANSTIAMLGPVATLGLAFVVLGETMGPYDFIGTALVIGGIAWMTLGGRRAR